MAYKTHRIYSFDPDCKKKNLDPAVRFFRRRMEMKLVCPLQTGHKRRENEFSREVLHSMRQMRIQKHLDFGRLNFSIVTHHELCGVRRLEEKTVIRTVCIAESEKVTRLVRTY